MANYIDYPNREEWLKGRIKSLGASEVACVLWEGFDPATELWKEKTGRKQRKDFSNDKRVEYGTNAEDYLRSLFALKHKDKYKVEYFPYRTYIHEKYPFLHATLDGELVKLESGKRGVWECKTVWVMSRKELENWNGKIPQKYYIQVLDQLCVMKYDFAVVTVELIFPDGNSEIRNYTIERNEQVENDIKYIETEAAKWWSEYVVKDKKPPIKMTL